MLLLKIGFSVKSLEISTLYRNFLFVFFMLLFLSSFLFTPQRALASNSNFKVSYADEVGYASVLTFIKLKLLLKIRIISTQPAC